MSMLHDNELLSYSVDFKKRTIILNTEYWHEKACEKTSVTFKNVTGHYFVNAGEMNTIIFDIDCYEIEQFIKDYALMLQDRKNYCWPLCYIDEADLIAKLHEQKQKYFYMQSSCGMCGFIIAEEMQCHTAFIK